MAKRAFTMLGIETSCDETAAAVVRGLPGSGGEILSNVVFSQLEEHAPFGGVVPEIAARAHIDRLDDLVTQAMTEAGIHFTDLDAVTATAGPGLVGGVMVGLMTAKAIAQYHGLPFVATNHLAGHALTVRLTDNVSFPYLLLLISGGHCQLLAVEGPETFRQYGTTIDDAVGEAFDKTAKLIGLPYPGGPAIEAAAKHGDSQRFALPKPLKGRPGADFSFSGLKTAVLQAARSLKQEHLSQADQADIAASFQETVADILTDRCAGAMNMFQKDHPDAAPLFVVAGGVAANQRLRTALTTLCQARGFSFAAPPPALCTDNGAMIAWAGLERFVGGANDPLDFSPRARWPLDPASKK